MKKEDLLAIAQEAAKSIKTEHDLNALTQMLSKITIEAALNAELNDHLGYDKYELTDSTNSRNGYTSKTILTGEIRGHNIQLCYPPAMARLARVVLPGYPHHITQRGNRRQDVFFNDSDYEYYLGLLRQWCAYESIEIWAYCLMTNHVHLIVKPKKKSNLSKAIGEVHRRYTRMINLRQNWKGYLWQGRFASYPMDQNWLLKAAAYVELNPVKAGMVKNAWDYRWSSVHAHLAGKDSRGIIRPERLLSLAGDWKTYLKGAQVTAIQFEQHERTGRPLGKERFIEKAERLLQRDLKKKKPGPKGKG